MSYTSLSASEKDVMWQSCTRMSVNFKLQFTVIHHIYNRSYKSSFLGKAMKISLVAVKFKTAVKLIATVIGFAISRCLFVVIFKMNTNHGSRHPKSCDRVPKSWSIFEPSLQLRHISLFICVLIKLEPVTSCLEGLFLY